MFRRRADAQKKSSPAVQAQPSERITSVIADGVNFKGKLTGSGGVRIEGAFDGEIELEGLLVISPSGRVTCPQLRAKTVIIAGALKGDIRAEKVEIRASGRVWGDVVAGAISTEEGAFMRGQIQMEEIEELAFVPAEQPEAETAPEAADKPAPKKKAAPKKKS